MRWPGAHNEEEGLAAVRGAQKKRSKHINSLSFFSISTASQNKEKKNVFTPREQYRKQHFITAGITLPLGALLRRDEGTA